jgi:hypothetical protein
MEIVRLIIAKVWGEGRDEEVQHRGFLRRRNYSL